MKSTKYQLLKADFDHVCEQLRLYRETIEELRKENENLKRYKKVLMENSFVRSKAIEAYEDAIRDAVSIAEAQGEDFRLEPWCTLRDILEGE